MPKITNEQMYEATKQRILRKVARGFARLGPDQANVNMIAEQAREIARQILKKFGTGHSRSYVSLFC